jgi:hypothetical protein
MAKPKGTRAGGKVTGTHTTVVPAAGQVVDIAERNPSVKKIVLGYIKSGLPTSKGLRRVKISQESACLLLVVRDNISQQEIMVYADNLELVKSDIASKVTKLGFKVVG